MSTVRAPTANATSHGPHVHANGTSKQQVATPPQPPQPSPGPPSTSSVRRSRRQFGQPRPASSATLGDHTFSPSAATAVASSPPPPPSKSISPQQQQTTPTLTTTTTTTTTLSTNATPVACPICNLTIPNLYQLNHHLDNVHPEEPEDVKSAIGLFFRNAGKVFNPITKSATTTIKNIQSNPTEVLRKIQQLDLDASSNGLAGPTNQAFQGWTDPRADQLVTKKHWVKESDRGGDVCFQDGCEFRLGIRYGKQNCRSCGNLFCEDHSMFQVKLNSAAKHDPSGVWCRVCENCFTRAKAVEDKQNSGGKSRTHTQEFMKLRAKNSEKVHLEVNRLEKRLEKLGQLHQSLGGDTSSLSSSPLSTPQPTTATSIFASAASSLSRSFSTTSTRTSISSTNSSNISGTSSLRHNTKGLLKSVTSIKGQQLKSREQTIVKWQGDSSVPGCFICLNMFTRYGNRKHHCRLCGRLVCENCSMSIPLYLNIAHYSENIEPVGATRSCKECKNLVFMKRDRAMGMKKPTAVVKYYESLMRLKQRIDLGLPKFQEMLSAIGQQQGMNHAHPDYQLAAKTRKELLDDFALFDGISKKIAKLPTSSQHQKQLQTNLYWWATQYLQTNMFPLSVIPKVFAANNHHNNSNNGTTKDGNIAQGGTLGKTASPPPLSTLGSGPNLTAGPSSTANNSSGMMSSFIERSLSPFSILSGHGDGGGGGNSTTPPPRASTSSSINTESETTIETLAQLQVLEEQYNQVQHFIDDASKKRRFDDVAALTQSLEELKSEMEYLRSGGK